MNANWDLVDLLFGSVPSLESLIYVAVGLAALYELYFVYQLYGARQPRKQMRGWPRTDRQRSANFRTFLRGERTLPIDFQKIDTRSQSSAGAVPNEVAF